MRSVLMIIATLALIGCSAEPASLTSSQVTETPSEEKSNFMADSEGNLLAADSFNITSVTIDYVYGWCMDTPDVTKIEKEDSIAAGKAVWVEAIYAIERYFSLQADKGKENNAKVRGSSCIQSSIVIFPEESMTGILEIGAQGVAFHPYFNESGKNLPQLTPRNALTEAEYTDNSKLKIDKEKILQVQPTPIHINHLFDYGDIVMPVISQYISGGIADDESYLELFEQPQYLEAEILFSSLEITGQSQARGEGIYRTIYSGYVENRSNPGQIKIIGRI